MVGYCGKGWTGSSLKNKNMSEGRRGGESCGCDCGGIRQGCSSDAAEILVTTAATAHAHQAGLLVRCGRDSGHHCRNSSCPSGRAAGQMRQRFWSPLPQQPMPIRQGRSSLGAHQPAPPRIAMRRLPSTDCSHSEPGPAPVCRLSHPRPSNVPPTRWASIRVTRDPGDSAEPGR